MLLRRLLMLTGLLLIVGCHNSSKRRVVVVHPEYWSVGEYRNCALQPPGTDVASTRLSQLDCHREAQGTPRHRMFVMDVEFSGDYSPPNVARGPSLWTCQRTKESMVAGIKPQERAVFSSILILIFHR